MTAPSRAAIAAEQLRAHFLAIVTDGVGLEKALKIVRRTDLWYAKNRQRYPQWAEKVTSARIAAADKTLPGMEFVAFRRAYFDNYTAPHHYRMIEAFELTQPGEVTAVLGFPGMGKTTTLVDRYCYMLGENPNLRIGVISEGQGLSRDIIGQVSNRMTDADRFADYHHEYGPFKQNTWDDNDRTDRDPLKRPWTADYFRILAATADQKDYSLASFGATSRVYGARFDWLIGDDIQSNETLANTEKYLRSFRTSWHSRTNLGDGKWGKTIFVGSRVGPGDIYETMDDQQIFDRLITIPALDRNITPDEHYTRINGKIVANPDCTAQPTWDRMTLQQLAVARAKYGEEIWARTWMQDSIAETGAVFTEQMLEDAKDRDRTLGPTAIGTDVWASIDPALDSGICAYMAAAITPSQLIILDSMGRTDTHTYTDIYDWVRNWGLKYRPSLWIVEENNFQKGMNQDDRLHTAVGRSDLYAHRTGRNKNDSIMGVRMMANAFAAGEIRIPWGDDRTRELMAPLVHELRTWKPNKRGSMLRMDRVMSLWFLWVRWQAERDSMGSTLPLLPRPSWVLRSA